MGPGIEATVRGLATGPDNKALRTVQMTADVIFSKPSTVPQQPWVVLCHDEALKTGQPWIVWYSDGDGDVSVGTYCGTLEEAKEEFDRRETGSYKP